MSNSNKPCANCSTSLAVRATLPHPTIIPNVFCFKLTPTKVATALRVIPMTAPIAAPVPMVAPKPTAIRPAANADIAADKALPAMTSHDRPFSAATVPVVMIAEAAKLRLRPIPPPSSFLNPSSFAIVEPASAPVAALTIAEAALSQSLDFGFAITPAKLTIALNAAVMENPTPNPVSILTPSAFAINAPASAPFTEATTPNQTVFQLTPFVETPSYITTRLVIALIASIALAPYNPLPGASFSTNPPTRAEPISVAMPSAIR